jgi:glutathione S-transferase
MLTLFHAPQSRSSRFVWLLEEIGAPYEIEYISIGSRPGGASANNPHPHKKAPALVHDGELIHESAAIALYLADAFPAAGLGPKIGEKGRGEFVTWLAYYAGVIEPAMVAKATSWESPPGMTGWAPFEEVVARITAQIEKGPWFLGDRFTVLDIMIGSLLQWAGRMFPDTPAYEAYKARIGERPALARAMAKDAALE